MHNDEFERKAKEWNDRVNAFLQQEIDEETENTLRDSQRIMNELIERLKKLIRWQE